MLLCVAAIRDHHRPNHRIDIGGQYVYPAWPFTYPIRALTRH